jgi:hypothetical protein
MNLCACRSADEPVRMQQHPPWQGHSWQRSCMQCALRHSRPAAACPLRPRPAAPSPRPLHQAAAGCCQSTCKLAPGHRVGASRSAQHGPRQNSWRCMMQRPLRTCPEFQVGGRAGDHVAEAVPAAALLQQRRQSWASVGRCSRCCSGDMAVLLCWLLRSGQVRSGQVTQVRSGGQVRAPPGGTAPGTACSCQPAGARRGLQKCRSAGCPPAR